MIISFLKLKLLCCFYGLLSGLPPGFLLWYSWPSGGPRMLLSWFLRGGLKGLWPHRNNKSLFICFLYWSLTHQWSLGYFCSQFLWVSLTTLPCCACSLGNSCCKPLFAPSLELGSLLGNCKLHHVSSYFDFFLFRFATKLECWWGRWEPIVGKLLLINAR